MCDSRAHSGKCAIACGCVITYVPVNLCLIVQSEYTKAIQRLYKAPAGMCTVCLCNCGSYMSNVTRSPCRLRCYLYDHRCDVMSDVDDHIESLDY